MASYSDLLFVLQRLIYHFATPRMLCDIRLCKDHIMDLSIFLRKAPAISCFRTNISVWNSCRYADLLFYIYPTVYKQQNLGLMSNIDNFPII